MCWSRLGKPLAAQCAGKSPDDLLFAGADGGLLRLNSLRHRVFKPAREVADLMGLRPHDLRHTAASLAIRSGANPKAVQRMPGHASAAKTLHLYAGLFADDLYCVAAALDFFVPQWRPELDKGTRTTAHESPGSGF